MSQAEVLSTRSICGIVGVVVLVLAMPFYFMQQDLAQSRAERKAREAACDQLEVKMYAAVRVKNDKFYEDEVFYAVRKFSESVEVKRPFDDNEKNNLRFLCSDLEKTEDPYKEMYQ